MIGYQRPWTSIHIDLDKTRVYVPRMQVPRFVCVYQMFVKLFTHKNPKDKYHLGKKHLLIKLVNCISTSCQSSKNQAEQNRMPSLGKIQNYRWCFRRQDGCKWPHQYSTEFVSSLLTVTGMTYAWWCSSVTHCQEIQPKNKTNKNNKWILIQQLKKPPKN